MKEMRACSVCGSLHPAEELTEFDDHLLCESCLHTETVRCSRCGERIWNDDNDGDSYTPLCQRCYDRYYTSCETCGRVIHYEDAYYAPDDDEQCEPYCYSCYSRHTDSTRSIHDYYYKPEPVFFGTGNRYMGIELEIDGAGEDSGNARRLLELANRSEEKLYIKHDGSLDSGMELVSHPMTLDYHMNHMPWADILREARELGYRSHQAGTCGLHIHINRTAFGSTVAEQEEVIARLLYFFEKNWEELLKFSRRTHNQLKQWADRYGLKEHPKDILKHAKGDGERYTCVNLLPYHTVEIRLMRGTLRHNSFLASLQLVDRIIDCAMNLNDEEMKGLSWTTFVAGCSHLPELVQYLKERRLFVNDRIESEPEV